jgi:hypothetical protein
VFGRGPGADALSEDDALALAYDELKAMRRERGVLAI